MNDTTFFLILRCALGLTGVWMVWLIIDAFWGRAKGEPPKDEPSGKGEPDSMDK